MDQITELHKKELAVLRKTHAVKQDMLEKKHIMRRKNFRNTILAEERKVSYLDVLLPRIIILFPMLSGSHAMS